MNSSKSDSDSDWDSDDNDFALKKIDIKIRPITQVTPSKISASVDELRATVGTWKSMANINLVKPNSRRHHQSTLQLDKNNAAARVALENNHNNNCDQANKLESETPFGQLATTTNKSIPSNSLSNGLMPLAPIRSAPVFTRRTSEQQVQSYLETNGRLFPVAFAIQECLNVRMLIGSGYFCTTNLIGHLKMAVPRDILTMDFNGAISPSSASHRHLVINLVSSSPWNTIRLNNFFVSETADAHQTGGLNHLNANNYISSPPPPPFTDISSSDRFLSSSSAQAGAQTDSGSDKVLSIDLSAVKDHLLDRQQQQHGTLSMDARKDKNYFLLPELLNYTIVSRNEEFEINHNNHQDMISDVSSHISKQQSIISPIQAVSHWLCDLNLTKVKVDLKLLISSVTFVPRLEIDDIKNLKISLQVNGSVISFQSRPEANWSQIDSRLTWSFGSLRELVERLNVNPESGIASCLARFDLSDGPSTPSDVSLQFSIPEKTLSGTKVKLVNSKLFKIVKQKQDVKTGVFKCEPPCV